MISPPRFPRSILRLLTPKHIVEELEGDLYEDFLDNISLTGLSKARRIYTWTVIRSFRPHLFTTSKNYRKPKPIDMFAYHIKMALRSFSKNSLNTSINLLGLVLGFACCMSIALFIIDNRSRDNFLVEADQIYRLESESEKRGKASQSVFHHTNTLPALAQYAPDILAYTRLNPQAIVTKKNTNGSFELLEERGLQIDPGFFEVFTYKLVHGNEKDLFSDPNTVIITESAAKRYYENGSAIGQTVALAGDQSASLKIVGILKELPGNSSLQFDMLIPKKQTSAEKSISFGGNFYMSEVVYVKLNKNVIASDVAGTITSILKKFTSNERFVGPHYSFKSLEEVKSDITLDDELIASTDQRVVTMFIILAVLIMSLVVINYINLSTAQAISRNQEVGIRKVTGANKRTLVSQFLTESMIICLIALPISIIVLELAIPYFEQILGRSLFFDYRSDPTFMLVVIFACISLGLVAGFYPSLLLSRFKFSEFLKGNLSTSKKGSWLRKGLITFQFTFSIVLIVSALLVQSQLDFIRNQSRAYNPEQIIVVSGEGSLFRKSYKVIKQEISNLSGVSKTAAASMAPGQDFKFRTNNPKIPFTVNRLIVDEDFLDLFEIKVLQGKNFNLQSDSAYREVIINETMASGLDLEDPLQLRGVSFQGGVPSKIIGIVSDFHFQSLHHNITPVLFNSTATMPLVSDIIVKVQSDHLQPVLAGIQKIWNQQFPDQIFNFEILDDRLKNLYTSEQRIADIFNIFTIVTILISCLGLFGLSTYTAQIKLKEVSIRKVLGARSIQLWILMTRQIYLLLILACLISIPTAVILARGWLADFAYRTVISPSSIILTIIVTFIIAGVTMSYKVINTAVSNPVDTLRNE